MRTFHVPLRTPPGRARAGGLGRVGRTSRVALAVAVVLGLTLVTAAHHSASAATGAPYGGTAADGTGLEATADTPSNTGAGADDMGWTTPGQWFNYTVNVATAGTYTVAFRVSSPYGLADGLHLANSSGTNLSGSGALP